ncbi:EF-hand domain-containing protein [Sphingomonas sp. RP10(2022)]|uniref:EF-hand domain-containing protein n=1 Tax=Sphingomonas liriopis TaxID=2949094 RepID=A0A9X2HTS9_9SPHN|nr:EF-hand domain-containing protein [Sphingomonas liriopis]MCP3735359.1 EF-hand domain-containing protein [Sphingomonas liriopis]
MWRYWAGGGAILATAGAGWMLLHGGEARSVPILPAQPQAVASGEALSADPQVPEATAATREEKRFNRYDKDRDGKVTRDEYLAARRKAFAKLDTNGDGRLDFDEWAIRATTKFATADRDKSGAMNATEFATTAVKRKAPSRAKCPPAQQAASAEDS